MLSKKIKECADTLKQEAVEWSCGKSWIARLPLLLWFVYILVRHLSNPLYSSIFGAVNLGVHELGHYVFSIFGNFIGTAGGTILQCLIPIIGGIGFYSQRDFFGISFAFGWMSTNLFDVSRYIADARAMELPLFAPFGIENVVHDWNYLLSRMGILQYDTLIAFFVKSLAVISMLICLLSGAWLLWQMYKHSSV